MAFNFKKNKNTIITIIIILAIALLVYYVKFKPNPTPSNVTEEVAKCIGENSIVYSQIGCHACEAQKELFGEYYNNTNEFVCNDNWEACTSAGIEATPTWLIKGQLYRGVQTIEELQEATGC